MGRKLLTAKKKRAMKSKGDNSPWFRKIENDKDAKWGFIPINLKGWVALILLIAINVFAADYFYIINTSFIGIGKFLVVFLLSIAVFVLIAERKTKK